MKTFINYGTEIFKPSCMNLESVINTNQRWIEEVINYPSKLELYQELQ